MVIPLPDLAENTFPPIFTFSNFLTPTLEWFRTTRDPKAVSASTSGSIPKMGFAETTHYGCRESERWSGPQRSLSQRWVLRSPEALQRHFKVFTKMWKLFIFNNILTIMPVTDILKHVQNAYECSILIYVFIYAIFYNYSGIQQLHCEQVSLWPHVHCNMEKTIFVFAMLLLKPTRWWAPRQMSYFETSLFPAQSEIQHIVSVQ